MTRQVVIFVFLLSFTTDANAQWFTTEARKCSDPVAVSEVKKHFEVDRLAQLNSNPLGQAEGFKVDVSRMRETQKYEPSIKKRFCRADLSVRFIGASEILKFGLALNGFDSETGQVNSTQDYTIQLLNDGTMLC
jgi:hypothetical protein